MGGIYTSTEPTAPLPLTGIETLPLDTNIPGGVSPQTAKVSTSQLAGYCSPRESVVAGRFYGVPAGVTPASLLTAAATLYAYPFVINNDVGLPLKTLGLSIITGQTGGAAHVGIYYDNSGYPGALVAGTDGGALAATSTANVNNVLATPVVLPAGKYWLASIFTASGTYPSVAGTGTGYFALGESLGSSSQVNLLATSGEGVTGISVAATYGALLGINNGLFPSGATLTLNAATPLVAAGF